MFSTNATIKPYWMGSNLRYHITILIGGINLPFPGKWVVYDIVFTHITSIAAFKTLTIEMSQFVSPITYHDRQ
jgi:hypothetical protein